MAKRRYISTAVTCASEAALEELVDEVRRRKRALAELKQRRKRLCAQILVLDSQLADHRPGVATAPRRYSKNRMTTVEALRLAIGDKEMPASEAARIMLASGFQTTSKTFDSGLRGVLSTHKAFERVSPGVYRVRRGGNQPRSGRGRAIN
ncbi:MAG: hypothetical protein JSR77_18670 [Planctomycetes bacterium]|nr:hypothetical protein [Planctomycetota bacterium]